MKYRPTVFRCPCGHDLETDVDMTPGPCSKCGKTEWKQLQGKSIVKDKSAPLELIEQQEKERAAK